MTAVRRGSPCRVALAGACALLFAVAMWDAEPIAGTGSHSERDQAVVEPAAAGDAGIIADDSADPEHRPVLAVVVSTAALPRARRVVFGSRSGAPSVVVESLRPLRLAPKTSPPPLA